MQSPWAIILCKFSDGDEEPFPMQYYQDLFTTYTTNSPWNMVRYFRDCSHGNADLSESKVFGWYNLSQSVEDYNLLGNAARGKLIEWARAATTSAGVDLQPFFKVVVCTNFWHDIGETATGVVSQGTTAIPRLLGHEMGHGYGLQHSRLDGSDIDYRDPWDIMSAASDFAAADEEFSLIGPGLNASNMRSLHWLDEYRVWMGGDASFDQTVKIRPLHRRDLSGFLAADLNGYLVEFRVREGWDGAIPRSAVLVHRFQDGHSYLMSGNSGSQDLVEGDSFGDPEPSSPVNPFSSFQRVDVVDINAKGWEATLRLRRRVAKRLPIAVDPMALILSDKAYQVWVEAHHPHEPKVAEIQAALRLATSEEKQDTLSRARTIVAYGKTVEDAIAGMG
jgi:hypothetical protein